MLGVVLLELCLYVVRLKHLAGLDVNVAMLLFACLVILGLMLDKCPEADATCLEKLIEFELEIGWSVKRYG